MRNLQGYVFLVLLFAGSADADSGPIVFTDEAASAGVTDLAVNSTGPTFVDYDNDGDVDIYVPTEAHLDGQGNRLFENDGAGRFRDVAVEYAVDNGRGLARGAAWGDFDNDGDMDLAQHNMPTNNRGVPQVPMTVYKSLLTEIENVEILAREQKGECVRLTVRKK